MADYRPQHEEAFEKVPGMQKSFGFRAVCDGQVGQRQWDCHCPPCLGSALSMSSYYVPQCEKGDSKPGKENVEKWHGCGVEKMDPAGVAVRRKASQGEGHKLAGKLKGKLGVFVAAQARGDNTEDYLIGVTVDAGNGGPIIKQVNSRSERINDTEFTRGDYAIAVQWFHRYAGDDSRLTFVKGTYDGDIKHDVLNSTDLRAVAFKMKEVQMPAPPRRVTRNKSTLPDVPDEPDVDYLLDSEFEDGILKQCW